MLALILTIDHRIRFLLNRNIYMHVRRPYAIATIRYFTLSARLLHIFVGVWSPAGLRLDGISPDVGEYALHMLDSQPLSPIPY